MGEKRDLQQWLKKIGSSEAITKEDLQQLIKLAHMGLYYEKKEKLINLQQQRAFRRIGVQEVALLEIVTTAKEGLQYRQENQTARLVEIVKAADKALNSYKKEPVLWKGN